MLVANVSRTWPEVLAGRRSAEDSVLGDWAAMAEPRLHQYGDAILGAANGTVVAAYDIEGWERLEDDRVRFHGPASTRWAHLIGMPSPVLWTRGQARPIRYVDSAELAAAQAADFTEAHRDRVSLRGWTLQLGRHDDAVLHVPAGGRVTIVTSGHIDATMNTPGTGQVQDDDQSTLAGDS